MWKYLVAIYIQKPIIFKQKRAILILFTLQVHAVDQLKPHQPLSPMEALSPPSSPV